MWQVGSRRIRLHAGDMIWVPPGVPHLEETVPRHTAHFGWVGFDLGGSAEIPLVRRRVTPAAPRGELRRLFELIQSESAAHAIGARERAHLALRELLILYARAATPSPPTAPAPPSRQATLAGAVAHSLTENLAAPLSIAALARYHGITPSHLARTFKRERGITPHAFLTQARLEHACRLLLDTNEPLKVVAAACGFTDDAHFVHQFRRAHHETPARWRRSRRAVA